MKRRLNVLLIATLLVFAGITAQATLLVEDHFNYATTNLVGNTAPVGGTWGGNNYAGIASGSLTSPSGFAAASGNKVVLGRASGAQTNTFTTQSSGTVYISYLAQFNSTNGKAFLIGGLSLLGGSEYAQLEYSNVTGNAWFNLGLGGRSTTLGPLPTNRYTTGTTHLIVVSYEFVAGTANDIMRIWIDPDSATFGGTAPTPYQTMTGFTDTTSLNTVDLKSSSSVPADTFIDELRVGTSWADVTPVQIQNQTITFPNPGNQTITNSVVLTATASSGLSVTYGVVSGSATLNGSTVTFTGTGSVTLSANQSGNGSWNPAPQTNVTFTVSKATATVTLNGLSQTYDGTARTVTATTTPAGKTVDITYDGSATAPVNAGSYTVVGTVNDTMYQGGATGTLVVAKANQTVTFTNPGSKITTDSVLLSATASSGLSPTFGVVSGPASVVGSTATFTGAGSVTLSANQSGDSNWNAAPQTNVTFSVTKATATVTLSNTNQVYTGSPKSVTAATVPSGLTVDITYNGSVTPPSAVGTYAVTGTVNSVMYQGSKTGILTISAAAGPVDVRAFLMEVRDVRTNGAVGTPPAPSIGGMTVRSGRASTNYLSSPVMMFQLPDLNGATILSAKLKFRVSSRSSMNSNNYCNINLEAIRSAPLDSAIVSNDYRVLGLRTNEIAIQNGIAVWTNSAPRDYETTGAATNTLGAWLADQYDNVGIGGEVLLRLSPNRDPVSTYYYSILNDSIELVITTAGDTAPSSGYGNTVSAQIGTNYFSWTFDQSVNWGRFIDGMPWVIRPAGGLNLVSVYPARSNNASVYFYKTSTNATLTNATINVTVRNPPIHHTFDTGTGSYVDNTNGIFGWDSRMQDAQSSPKYNASLGWDGATYLALSNGDSIATAKSMSKNPMPSRATALEALAVLTVLPSAPPADAFRPAVIRTGTDRTTPEILRYSDLIDLAPYLISNPVNTTTDLRGSNVTAIASRYTFNKLGACIPGPGFIGTGYIASEGDSALYNTYAWPGGAVYGGSQGGYIGQLAVGSLAGWLTEDQRKFCRVRYIQRAIDAYGSIKAGVGMEEGCGVFPGYSTLITVAGVMMNHSGMKGVNNGVDGVQPWFLFADYACHYHTDGVSTNDLVPGETTERLISLYSATTNNYPELNKTNTQPIAAASSSTMTIKTNFWWGGSRPIYNIINLKFKIVSGAGAGSTIYVITNAITATNLLTNDEKFRTTGTGTATLYNDSGNVYGYYYGGKVGIKPTWQNGTPDSSSVLAFSTTTSDTDNPKSDNAEWFWCPDGVMSGDTPVTFEHSKSISTSPSAEYSGVHGGATVDNLIALYALGQQNLYKGGVDKYLINAGERAGYGEVIFQADTYFEAIAGSSSGSPGNTRGALWKQEVLNAVGATFQYTDGTSGALDVPHTHAKMWYEP
jgi:hypothetical protein